MNAKDKSNVRSTFTGILVVLGAVILLLPPGAQADHCKGKHKDWPGCGEPGGGSSEVPLSTTFNCPTGSAAGLSCPDSSNPSLFQADAAAAPYEHDVDDVLNVLNDNGRFVLSMHKRQNKVGTRKVWWSFPMAVDFESVFDVSGTDDLDISRGIDHKTVIQVGKFTAVDLRALAPAPGPGNVARNIDMILDLYLATGKQNNDILFVRYSPTANGQCPGPRATSGVTVTRTDDGTGGPRTWTIEAPAGALACMYTIQGLDYGDFDFGPLVLSLTEQL